MNAIHSKNPNKPAIVAALAREGKGTKVTLVQYHPKENAYSGHVLARVNGRWVSKGHITVPAAAVGVPLV